MLLVLFRQWRFQLGALGEPRLQHWCFAPVTLGNPEDHLCWDQNQIFAAGQWLEGWRSRRGRGGFQAGHHSTAFCTWGGKKKPAYWVFGWAFRIQELIKMHVLDVMVLTDLAASFRRWLSEIVQVEWMTWRHRREGFYFVCFCFVLVFVLNIFKKLVFNNNNINNNCIKNLKWMTEIKNQQLNMLTSFI